MKLVYTIWALLLNAMGVSVFKTCFSDAMEDDYGDLLLTGPAITSIIFTLGVYTVISNLNFYPTSFRKLTPPLMALYEFLVTSFILEFSVACIWAPVDVHIYTTLTRAVCKALIGLGANNVSTWLIQNKFPMAILCYVTAIGFFLITLHITRSVDFQIYLNNGPKFFADHLKSKMVETLTKELPKLAEVKCNECQKRKKSRSRKHSRRPDYSDCS